MTLYFLGIGFLLFGGLISIFLNEKDKTKLCTVFSGISTLLFLIVSIYVLLTGNVLVESVKITPFFNVVDFIIDPLSAFFVIVISIMSFLGVLYSNGYIKPYFNKGMNLSSHNFFLMTLIASMIMVVTVHNALFFLIVWEIM